MELRCPCGQNPAQLHSLSCLHARKHKPHPGEGTVEPGFLRRRFSWVFAYKSCWGRANTGDGLWLLNTVREMQESFDLSIGQLSRRIAAGIGHRRRRIWLCFEQEFEFGVFMIGKRLRIAYFSYICFPIRAVFPANLRKRIKQLFPPKSTYLFTTRHSWWSDNLWLQGGHQRQGRFDGVIELVARAEKEKTAHWSKQGPNQHFAASRWSDMAKNPSLANDGRMIFARDQGYPPEKKNCAKSQESYFPYYIILYSGLMSRSEKDIVALSIKRPADWFSSDKRVHNPNAARFNPLIKLGQILSPAAFIFSNLIVLICSIQAVHSIFDSFATEIWENNFPSRVHEFCEFDERFVRGFIPLTNVLK